MKLYISCSNHTCKHFVHINGAGRTRQELANSIGYSFNITCPICHNVGLYNVNNVFAGPSDVVNTHAPKALGGFAGGAVAGGLIAGPPGMLIGMVVGFLTGGGISTNSEKNEITRFNNS